MKTAEKANSSAQGKGQAWLAGRLKISQQRVSQLVAEGRIPRRTAYTESEVQAAARMLAESRSTSNNPGNAADEITAITRNPLKVAQIQLLIERKLILNQRRLIEAGHFIEKAAVETGWVKRIVAVRSVLQEIAQRADELANQPADVCRVWLENELRRACNIFAGGNSDEIAGAAAKPAGSVTP